MDSPSGETGKQHGPPFRLSPVTPSASVRDQPMSKYIHPYVGKWRSRSKAFYRKVGHFLFCELATLFTAMYTFFNKTGYKPPASKDPEAMTPDGSQGKLTALVLDLLVKVSYQERGYDGSCSGL